MRWVLFAFLMVSSSAQAWEFTPGLPCKLDHAELGATVALTYDPTEPLYAITISRPKPWPKATVFAITFDGPAGLTISTDRQTLSPDGLSVTVADRGFGNVLNGLQLNDSAIARLGDVDVTFSLSGAADPVAAFRACRPAAGA